MSRSSFRIHTSKMAQLSVLLLTLCVSVDLVQSTDYLPISWTSVCRSEVNNTTHVNVLCTLGPNDPILIDFDHLNNITRNLTEDTTLSVDIKCQNGGNLTMPWPMKITGLINLRVQGCVIHDFTSDWNNKNLDGTPDSLQSLIIVDSTALVNIQKLLQSINEIQNFSKEWNCGHDTTLRRIVLRSVKYDLEMMDLNGLTLPPDDLMVQFLTGIENVGSDCYFKHLEYIEESEEEVVNAFHFRIMADDSEYPNLKYINYSNSIWREIPADLNNWGYKYTKLELIDFSNNRISEVTLKNYISSRRDKDTVLDVRSNNITDLSIQDIRNWADNALNMMVDVRENPLNCDCLKQDFIFQMQDETFFVGNLLKYRYIQDMTCATPPSARGKTIKSLSIEDMGCPIPPVDLTVPLVVLAVVAVILIIIIILIVRYRKEIKIILYTRFDILLPNEISDSSDNKKYTAFVSYSSENGDWVHDYLQQNLEVPSDSKIHAFRLCLHERDFIGGKTILDNIIYSIENSRHTIVILSRQFLKSVWGMEEFTQAYNESIVKKRRHLIIVKLEDILDDELPTALRRCLKTFTYLDANDKMFLDRLRYSLAVRSKLVRYDSSVSVKTQISSDSGYGDVDEVNASEQKSSDESVLNADTLNV